MDDVVAQVLKLGKGSELVKVDVQQAYRNVPVPIRGTGTCWVWSGKAGS